MKTMFTLGFSDQEVFGQLYPLRRPFFMGQTTVDGNKILSDISNANSKLAAIKAWMANRPNWQAILGPDLGRWLSLQDEADRNVGDVNTVQQTLSQSNPSGWTITQDQQDSIANWLEAINGQYTLISAHPQLTTTPTGAPAGAPAAAKPAVPAPASGPSPLVMGVGAAAVVGLLIFAFKK